MEQPQARPASTYLPRSRCGRVLFGILVAALVALAVIHLDTYPRTWFDEGWHLLAARHVALTGEYEFGPAIGPTVIYPVAWAFQAFAVGLLQARVVMVVYLLLALGAFYVMVCQMYDADVALIGLALLASSRAISLVAWGRQMLGEVPALAFLCLGSIVWFRSIDRTGKRLGLTLIAGVLFALSILTKNQFAILLPALLLAGVMDRFYHRQLPLTYLALLLATVVLCTAAWFVVSGFLTRAEVTQSTMEEWRTAPFRSLFLLKPSVILSSARSVFGPQAFLCWGLPGLIYGGLSALQRGRQGLKTSFLFLFALLWLTWYMVGSVGWQRYAVPGLAVLAVFVGALFRRLVQGERPTLGALRSALRKANVDPLTLRLCFAAVLLAMVLYPLVQQARSTAARDATPQAMAAYMDAHLEPEALVETWEMEIIFLTEQQYHTPPGRLLDVASRKVAVGQSDLHELYNYRVADPDYVLVGEFAKWTAVYPVSLIERECTLVTSIGAYDLYKVRK